MPRRSDRGETNMVSPCPYVAQHTLTSDRSQLEPVGPPINFVGGRTSSRGEQFCTAMRKQLSDGG
jgi:hypothetical protein